MNNSELINYTKELIERDDKFMAFMNPYGYGRTHSKEYDYWQSVLSVLTRTRIRQTATEPPTREDADKNGLILGYHANHEMFDAYKVKTIIEYQSEFPFWTQMPQLPEETR